MRSIIFTILFLGLCSQQGTILSAFFGPNQQQANRIERITAFTQELEEFLQCLSTKATIWQKFFGKKKWVDLGTPEHKQRCHATSWDYKKNKTNGTHVLYGITRDFIRTATVDVDANGILEISTEFCQCEKKDQLLYYIVIQNQLKKFISWYQLSNPNDVHKKETAALNKLKGTLLKFLSAFKKEFKDTPLIERDAINSFLRLKLPAQRNIKQILALAIAGGAVATCAIITIRKLLRN